MARQLNSLPPDLRWKAEQSMRLRGALGPPPPQRDTSLLWCGHLASGAVKDGDIEYCPECSDG